MNPYSKSTSDPVLKDEQFNVRGCRNLIINIIVTIIFAAILMLLITLLTSGCCIAYDIKATVDNPKLETPGLFYYPEIVEVYKPVKNRVILRSDSIREITK